MVTKAQRQDKVCKYTHNSRIEQASEITMTPAPYHHTIMT